MTFLPRQHTRRIGLLVATLAMVAVAASCAGQSGDSNSDDRATAATGYAELDRDAGAPQREPENAAAALSAPDALQDRTSAKTSNGTNGKNRPAPTERSIIRTGNVAISHDDVEQAGFEIREILDRHRGEVGSQQTGTDSDGVINRLRFEIRVPSAQFDETMVELGEVGQLRSSDAAGEDVTTQVIDTASRVRTQERSIARIQSLLAEAANLNQVIAIESQLANRQADLESLKAQLAFLEDQSSLSTITVNVQRSSTDEVSDDNESGFLAGLEDGWSGLGSVASGAATGVGMLLPFAVVLLLVGTPLWLVLRRRQRPQAVTRAE